MPKDTTNRTPTRTHASALLLVGALLGVGCSRSERPARGEDNSPAGWTHLDSESLGNAELSQLEDAERARDAFASRLMAELTGAITAGGPGNAVDVCNVRAPRIAEEIDSEFGVRIGRTSHKLRNPDNAGPGWMRAVVEGLVEEPRVYRADDGTLGASFPIRAAGPCLLCHGDPGSIIPEARAQIAAHYPEDRATGFAAGDLRGWFWIEVPAE